jgi:uncharacterized protein YegP (UPF0339 family)
VKTETKQTLIAIPLAALGTAIVVAAMAGCLALFGFALFGCVTVDGKKQVSPLVLRITEDVACAGTVVALKEDPGLRATFNDVRGWLDVLITRKTNYVGLSLEELPKGQLWFEPAVMLFYAWSGNPAEARKILVALKNGLDCGFPEPIAIDAAGDALAVAASKPDRVDIFKDKAGEWRWRRVASNGRIVSAWGEGSTRRWNAERSAKRVNPGLTIVIYQ